MRLGATSKAAAPNISALAGNLAAPFKFLRQRQSSRNVTRVTAGLGSAGQGDTRPISDPTQMRARMEEGSGVMLKTVYAFAAAAIVAGAFVGTLSLPAQVEARGSVPSAKADRADARPLARDCSRNEWPYFEAACLRDTRNTFGQARDVRFVSADRLTRPAAPAR
jgi:hypothetical protein